jgi:spore germination protein
MNFKYKAFASKVIKLSFIFFGFSIAKAIAFENLVYTWRGFPNNVSEGSIAINDFKKHASAINIISSEAYHVNQRGLLFGSLNPEMLQIAKAAHVKIMPLVGNANFDTNSTHDFLSDLSAQERAVQFILQICKENNFYGVQIDFEHMLFTDKDAFTNFYQKIARVLHQNGFKIAIAMIPKLTEDVPQTDYLRGKYEYWSGVYDYKAIGESSDFVTLMTYDQHAEITTPGPMSGLHWDEAIIQYALKYIPSNKISLGVPLHSGYWYTGFDPIPTVLNNKQLHAVQVDKPYKDMMRLLKDNNATVQWDNDDKMHYAMFRSHFLYEYIFMEDVDSLKAKLDLVKRYNLRGISDWCIGEEDPKIWSVLEKDKDVSHE